MATAGEGQAAAAGLKGFVVNEKGERWAVILGIDEYRRLIDYLEELEDALELKRALEEGGEFVDLEDFVARMKAEGKL